MSIDICSSGESRLRLANHAAERVLGLAFPGKDPFDDLATADEVVSAVARIKALLEAALPAYQLLMGEFQEIGASSASESWSEEISWARQKDWLNQLVGCLEDAAASGEGVYWG